MVPSSKSSSRTSLSALALAPLLVPGQPPVHNAPLSETETETETVLAPSRGPVLVLVLVLVPVPLPSVARESPTPHRAVHSVADHSAGEVLLAATVTALHAHVPPLVRALLSLAEGWTGWDRGGGLQAISVGAMATIATVALGQGATLYVQAARAQGHSLALAPGRGRVPCRTRRIRGTPEAGVAPGRLAGEGEAIAEKISGIAGLGHQEASESRIYQSPTSVPTFFNTMYLILNRLPHTLPRGVKKTGLLYVNTKRGEYKMSSQSLATELSSARKGLKTPTLNGIVEE